MHLCNTVEQVVCCACKCMRLYADVYMHAFVHLLIMCVYVYIYV